jgi:gluconate 5-dehydrogenase
MRTSVAAEPRGLKDVLPQQLFDLRGRTALVTGAAGGIGRWLAAGLAASGASVALTDINRSGLESLSKELDVFNVAVTTHGADLCAGDAHELVADVCAKHGRIDVLVNCAAVNHRGPITEISLDQYTEIMSVNLTAPYLLSRAAVRQMSASGGSIVHIGSVNSAYGLAGVSVYGASKAGLSQLTRVQAIEWASLGVRVNCLAPGFIRTPLSEPLWRDPRRAEWIVSRTPIQRPGHPSELVGQLLVLASDAGSFITGQTFYVDGGFLAGGNWGVT